MEIELPYKWKPRAYQMDAWRHFFPSAINKRAVVIGHRRWGKDLFGINLCGVKSQERVGTYWHVLPTYRQGRNIVWNGCDFEGRAFLDYLHPALIDDKHTNDMRVKFKNGSFYQVVGSDDFDRLVGTNPVGVVMSEYALQDPRAWDYLSPILRENKGWAIFITTFRGKNHAWRLARAAERLSKEDKDWFYLNQTVNDTKREDGTPVVSPEDVEKDRKAGRPEPIIQQEYFNNADAPLLGAYYASEMAKVLADGRIGNVPYAPELPVDTHWDLGMKDSTCITFTQQHGLEIRVIDFYDNSGEGLAHYKRVLQEKGYTYRFHHAPHDISVREMTLGKSRWEVARSLGIQFKITPKHSVMDGIERVRNVLHRCWFDEKKCARLIEALRSYRKEEAPTKLGYTGDDELAPRFKDMPLHDWASDPADSFRIMAWSVKDSASGNYSWPEQERYDTTPYQYV